jgi:hypothetical protein
MRRFRVGGYSVEVDEGREWIAWRARWGYTVGVTVMKLVCVAAFAPWVWALISIGVLGEWDPPLDRATGLAWVLSRTFGLFLLAMGVILGLALLGVLWELLGFLTFGTGTYALDRWEGRFRLGRRTLCALDQVEGVRVDVEDDPEGGRGWSIGLLLKGGRLRTIPHFDPGLNNPAEVGLFVDEVAGLLGVPVIKGDPVTPKQRAREEAEWPAWA